jgi:putative ubiquitin-RnfH superfamily antitoxin RatB of RatAB toxin-antitoxin module
MRVGVAYSDGVQQTWLRIEVPDDATVGQVIERSGVLGMFPSINLDVQKIGIFGKVVKLDAPLRAGDRVEIYRPITCDPTQVPRRNGMADDDG